MWFWVVFTWAVSALIRTHNSIRCLTNNIFVILTLVALCLFFKINSGLSRTGLDYAKHLPAVTRIVVVSLQSLVAGTTISARSSAVAGFVAGLSRTSP